MRRSASASVVMRSAAWKAAMSRHMVRGIATDFRSGGSMGGLLMPEHTYCIMVRQWCYYGVVGSDAKRRR